MKELSIRGGIVLVDDEDFEDLSRFPWHLSGGNGSYAARSVPHPHPERTRQYTLLMSRYLLGIQFGDRRQVDHIDRNKLNNQRSNLRLATQATNNQNPSPRRNARSQYRGVTFWKPAGRKRGYWRARASLSDRQYSLGYYDTEEEASEAAKAWRLEHMSHALD